MTDIVLFVLNTIKNVFWPDELGPYHDFADLLSKLSTNNDLEMTDEDCDLVGLYVHSDGCTRASQAMKPECKKHDFRYRTHLDFYGRPTTKWATDLAFLVGMVVRSNPCRRSEYAWLRSVVSFIPWFYPWIWARFFAVVLAGGKAWNNHTFCRP